MTITVYKNPDQETFIESHIWNPWSSVEIYKTLRTNNDGSTKTFYSLYVDGDYETDTKTIKEARAYIQELRDSWIENHPGEKLPWGRDKLKL